MVYIINVFIFSLKTETKNSTSSHQTNDTMSLFCFQVYSLMNECWAYNFEERPCFSVLENKLKSMLQEKRDNGHDY